MHPYISGCSAGYSLAMLAFRLASQSGCKASLQAIDSEPTYSQWASPTLPPIPVCSHWCRDAWSISYSQSCYHSVLCTLWTNVFEQSWCHCRVGATPARRSNCLQTRRIHHQVKYWRLNANTCIVAGILFSGHPYIGSRTDVLQKFC